MNDRLSLSVFTIEIDGKPTLAFEAKRYSEAEAISGDEGLRARLRLSPVTSLYAATTRF